jgi:hypothetical protein
MIVDGALTGKGGAGGGDVNTGEAFTDARVSARKRVVRRRLFVGVIV